MLSIKLLSRWFSCHREEARGHERCPLPVYPTWRKHPPRSASVPHHPDSALGEHCGDPGCPALWTEFQVLYPGHTYSTICPFLPSIPDILRMLCLLLAFQKDWRFCFSSKLLSFRDILVRGTRQICHLHPVSVQSSCHVHTIISSSEAPLQNTAVTASFH